MIRIGHVRYLNTLPLVEGLAAWREAELVQAVPAALAPMLTGEDGARSPRIDVGLCSVVDAVRSRVPLALIPAGMIGCDGPTLTVRLYSAVPWARVTRVHADTDSHTSVVLAQVLLRRRHGVMAEVVEFDAERHEAVRDHSRSNQAGWEARDHSSLNQAGWEARPHGASSTQAGWEARPTSAGSTQAGWEARPTKAPHWPETLLVIGDKVVTDPPPAGRYAHQMDLGEAWREWTGLPFVYAMWMCRAAEAGTPAVRLAGEVLARQRQRNTVRLDWLVDRYAGERGWPADLARRYVGELLRYAVGPREREAVERFVSEAREAGLIAGGAVRWAALDSDERRVMSDER